MKKTFRRALAIVFAVTILLTTVISASAAQPPVAELCMWAFPICPPA